MDKIMTMFGFSVGLLGIKTITSNIGGNKVVIEGADENGKQTSNDKKPTRNKFAEAAGMDDEVVDA